MSDGLPSVWLVRGVQLTLVAAGLIGLYLLLAPPTLPNERQRTAAAPPSATVPPPVARPGTGAASPAPATAVPAPSASPRVAGGTPVPSPQAARSYTIKPGDTLLAIAEQYDTTVDAIRAANPGLSETALRVGAEITIPPGR